MQKEVEKHIKNKYNNISSIGYKYTCRAVELLINNDKLAMMDIYKLISIENNKTVSGIVKNIRVYKNRVGMDKISSKEFIHQIKYQLKEE